MSTARLRRPTIAYGSYVRDSTTLALAEFPTSPALRVLDIGSGTGLLLRRALDAGDWCRDFWTMLALDRVLRWGDAAHVATLSGEALMR